jgi:hypothetical protein
VVVAETKVGKVVGELWAHGKTDRAPGHGLAVFESRSIAPKGVDDQLTVDEACELAWNQFLLYLQIEESHEWGSEVGTYPDETPF